MRVHLDVLGWLYRLVGAMGVLCGASLSLLAAGTLVTLDGDAGLWARATNPVVSLLAVAGLLLVAGGVVMVAVGRALGRRQAGGRRAALLAALPNLALLPFGTALGIYSFWALLNDEARLAFGRPPRGRLQSPDVHGD